MYSQKHPKIRLHFPPRGLLMQLITIILLPLTVILLAITFGSITVHQRAMRTMVGERDGRTVDFAAKALSAQIDARVKELNTLAMTLNQAASEKPGSDFSRAQFLSTDFDTGLAVFDDQGAMLRTLGDVQLWEALATDPASWQQTFAGLIVQGQRLKVITSPLNGEYLGLTASIGNNGEVIVGAFSIPSLVKSVLGNILSTTGDFSLYLVGLNGEVLFHSGDIHDDSMNHPGVAEALSGESGTVYVEYEGDEHVTAYSPVPVTGWALITEESWEAVSTPALQTSQTAPLVLVPALLIMSLALWLGARQIVQPLRTLETRAANLASGDFASIQEPVGGIDEIKHLQDELIEMALKVQEAQHSLHGYIGSITAAQEEERHRLARELHDDTLQALIALKQRVQLAQLELQPVAGQAEAHSAELDEIGALTEQTIENLRRLTRALRPIYLEDLGLVPALEMLTREAVQGTDIDVEFQRHGTERRLDAHSELALYRMAQEALSNISRHSSATKASLTISFSQKNVILSIEDNGKGFNLPKNPTEFSSMGHFGLLGLQERAELIGASLEIITSPGKGTKLSVTLTA